MIKVNFINDTVSVIDEDIQLTPLVEEEVSKISVKVHKANVGAELPTDDIYVYSSDMDNVTRIYKGVNNAPRQLYPTPLAVPELTGTYTYTGGAQTVTISPYDTTKIAVSGDTTATNVGTYTVVFSLINNDDVWEDGTTSNKTSNWSIGKGAGYIDGFNDTTLTTTKYTISGGTSGVLTAQSSDPSMVTVNLERDQGGYYEFYYRLNMEALKSGDVTITLNVAESDNTYATSKTITITNQPGYRNYEDSKNLNLTQGRWDLASAMIGNYALFAGGRAQGNGYIWSDVVDAFDTLFVRTNPTALSQGRSQLQSATIGNYAVFAGGGHEVNNKSNSLNVVDAYNTSLTRSTPTALSKARVKHIGAKNNNYAIFAGGQAFNNDSYSEKDISTVDAYNTSLTRSIPTGLSLGRGYLGGATIGNYALIAGGKVESDPEMETEDRAVVDAYNTSLTRSTPTALSIGRSKIAGGTVGNYAILAGGEGYNRNSSERWWRNEVDAYNTSLTRSTPTALSKVRINAAAANIDANHIVITDGDSSGYGYWADLYDSSLTKIAKIYSRDDFSTPVSATINGHALVTGDIWYTKIKEFAYFN